MEHREKRLNLCVGDTYDFGAEGYAVSGFAGTALGCVGDTVTALTTGTGEVTVTDPRQRQCRVPVTVYAGTEELGGRYPLDRGLFQGKRVIVFGDSITDGCLLDPEKPVNYEDTYFAKLCGALGAASDPTDLEACNFACGGTTLTYGLRRSYGISGVERVDRTEPFTEGGHQRDPYPNILRADLCVIEYGANDFDEQVPAGTSADRPERAEQAVTVRGGMYYMLRRLRALNPSLKFLVLPPLYRRANGTSLLWTDDRADVRCAATSETLRDYGRTIREVCGELGAKMIDWYGAFDYESFGREDADRYTLDGLHPNAAGHEVMFRYILKKTSFEEE